MAKNGMLAKLEAKYEAYYKAMFASKMETLLQMAQDAATIAAHDTLGMGPGRAVKFCAAYRETINRMANLTVDDAKDDKDFWYAKAKIDEELMAIVGEENFAPWEERYGE